MSIVKKKKLSAGISALFLFIALFDGLPYGYFTMLRFIICFNSGYLALLSYNNNKEIWSYGFGVIAVLFNPIIPIHLTRGIWITIDSIVGVFMIISIFKLKIENKYEGK